MATRSPEVLVVRALSRLHLYGVRRGRRRPAAERRDRRRSAGWGWSDNIVGLAVSTKRTRELGYGREPCVTVFVRHKLPKRRLPAVALIPEQLTLESAGVSVLTDVVVLRSRPVAHGPRVRPLQPGAEVGNVRGGVGTLGLIVRRRGTAETLALSCSHVLARSGRLADGETGIEQPVVDDDDQPDEVVGALVDHGFSTLRSGSTARNDADVAIATLTAGASPALLATGQTPLRASVLRADQFTRGMRTVMSGIVTQSAHGRVIGHEAVFTIDQMPFVNGVVPFSGLVAYETRCARGDSGAAVMKDGEPEVLGIHTAGVSEDRFGLFQPIGPILDRFGLELVTA
jgi:hypothetical protein